MGLEEELNRITDRQELVEAILKAPPEASFVLVRSVEAIEDGEAVGSDIEGWMLNMPDVQLASFVLASFIAQINGIEWDNGENEESEANG